MGVMLDTSVLVAAERGTLRLVPLLAAQGEAPVAIAAITAAELLHGCHRAADAGVRARRFAFVEAALELVPILPFGLIEARRHAELWAQLARDGTMIGPHDLLIAATALAQGHELATLNRAEFARVAGLRLLPLDRFVT
jgi:predicted nucleic acid-binding protein